MSLDPILEIRFCVFLDAEIHLNRLVVDDLPLLRESNVNQARQQTRRHKHAQNLQHTESRSLRLIEIHADSRHLIRQMEKTRAIDGQIDTHVIFLLTSTLSRVVICFLLTSTLSRQLQLVLRILMTTLLLIEKTIEKLVLQRELLVLTTKLLVLTTKLLDLAMKLLSRSLLFQQSMEDTHDSVRVHFRGCIGAHFTNT